MCARKALLNQSNIADQVLAHYGIEVDDIEEIVKGAMSNTFKLSCAEGDESYFLKEPLTEISKEAIVAEAELLSFLKQHDIPVADFVKTLNGTWYFRHGNKSKPITLQKFIEGTEHCRSNVPRELLVPSFSMLGRINACLENYKLRPRKNISVERCEDYNEDDVVRKLDKYLAKLNNINITQEELRKITKAVKYVQRIQPSIKEYGLFFKYLTYVSTHGDYHTDNLIFDGDEIVAVVDWTSSCYMPACINLMFLGLDYGTKDAGVKSVDISALSEGLRAYAVYAPLSYYDYKLMPYAYLHAWGKRAILSRIKRYVGYKLAGNDEMAQRTLKIVMGAVSVCKYFEKNADLMSRQLEKYYEQTLSKDELGKHKRWLKGQDHIQQLYKQESAARRRHLLRRIVPLALRRVVRRILSIGRA